MCCLKNCNGLPGAVTMQDNADSPQEPHSENLFAFRLITSLKKVAKGDGKRGELYSKMHFSHL